MPSTKSGNIAFFKAPKESPIPSVSAHTAHSKYENVAHEAFVDNSLYTNNSVHSPPSLQSNSLESSSSLQWELEPELPRNMLMPCVATSTLNDENEIDSNRIYILGSHNDRQCWLYDATYKTYEKLLHFPKKIIPKGHCIATCNNIIFSTGGTTASKHLLLFNTATQDWHTGALSHTKDVGIGAKCVAIRNKRLNDSMELHIVGGSRKPNRYLIYNRTFKRWREGPKLPLKLTYHGMVYVAKNRLKGNSKAVKPYLRDHRPQILVFGGCQMKSGWGSSSAPSMKMYRLYVDDRIEEEQDHQSMSTWTHIGDLPVAIQNFAFLCVLNNYILIFGGDLGGSKYSRNIYMYNITRKRWKLSCVKLPKHLFGTSAIETRNGVIHIFGGHNGKTSQRLHYSIKTSKLLQKEFDEFDASFTWKQLSRSTGCGGGYNCDDDDLSLLDELKRMKRKLKDMEENYNMKQSQYKHIYEQNQQMKSTNINLLDKLARVMQAKEEMSYELQEVKKAKAIKSRSKSVITSHQQFALDHRMVHEKSDDDDDTLSPPPQQHKKRRRHSSRHRHHRKRKMTYNPYKDNCKNDPKYVMFRNFLYGRIGLHQYLSEFEASRFSDICKVQSLTDEDLKFAVGISNELHRKLILKTINEFKLEVLQFKTWIMSYDEKPNLVQYVKGLSKYGIITWHLLAQHIRSKEDFKYKLFIDKDDAIHCLYEHLIEFLNGSIPKPNPNGMRGNELEYKYSSYKTDHSMDHSEVLFDDSGYHNW